MKLKLLAIALLLTAGSAFCQRSTYQGFPSLIWPKLYNITFKKAKDAQGEIDIPVFTAEVKNLQGKKITIPGYIVPFEGGMRSNHLMFSSMPLNACFFCGVGGPETVIEVYTEKEINYTDKPVEVEGILKLNDKNPDQMIYVLQKAKIVGEVGF